MENKKVIIGGTFDIIHDGHRALLGKAFNLGQVYIGLVSDSMAIETKKREVNNFKERQKALEDFTKTEFGKNPEIFEINDIFGPTIEKEFDYIIVSPETDANAEIINEKRKEIGKFPIEIIKIDYVLAEDGKPISSTRIINKEIDKQGKLIK